MSLQIVSPRPAGDGPNSHPGTEPPRNDNSPLYDLEPWPDPVDGAALLDELTAVLKKFCILPPHAPEALALWILHTYAFPLRNITSYLAVVSPEKRCGKTTLLNLLGALANRAMLASNISAAALWHVIEETQPTLLIDEADTFLTGNDELRGIINSGYKRESAYVFRRVAGNLSEPPARPSGAEHDTSPHRGRGYAAFSCWCPKVMAAIGSLPETITDRCIVIAMQRKMPGEACERLRKLNSIELKRKCRRFVLDHAADIRAAEPAIPDSFNDRTGEIWEPLLVLADLAANSTHPGAADWPARARQAAAGLHKDDAEATPLAFFLIDIYLSFLPLNRDRAFTRELVESLNARGDRQWSVLRPGRSITEVWLSRQLRELGIQSKTIWIGDVSAKGYEITDFREVFQRYLPRITEDPKPPPDPKPSS